MGKRKYELELGNPLLKHLGLQMYGGAVPAIAELISNAYDAMARNVWISIPVGKALEPTDQIVVGDDGHGMTYEECNKYYLKVGRDRRDELQSDKTRSYNGLESRRVQGRKGIGKLAGFGIAKRIEVETISESRQKCCFGLDYERLFESNSTSVLDTLEGDGEQTKDEPGTVISLRDLKITRKIVEDEFVRSIARRMLILGDNFAVYVNDRPITRGEIDLQFRFPNDKKWETHTLESGEPIKWWIGFCKKPIKSEEQRGVVVYVRGKLAQRPWFFDLSGGMGGQHGMQYMTGEVQADFLDEKEDLIVTDRGGIRWEDPAAEPLKFWGQNKVRQLLSSWVEMRVQAKSKTPKVSAYLNKAEELPPSEKAEFKKRVTPLLSIPQIDKEEDGRDIVDDLVEFIYNAITNRGFLDIVRQLNALKSANKEHIAKILSKWDLVEAVSTIQRVKVRMEILDKFEQMIQEEVPEKPDMQNYLREHPWLINPQWSVLVHERELDKLISGKFELEATKTDAGRRRLDFFCLGDRHNTAYVVEVKRPGRVVPLDELHKLGDYVTFLKEQLGSRRITISGLLIADTFGQNKRTVEFYREKGVYEAVSWKVLLGSARTLHEGLLERAQERANNEEPET